MLYHQFTGFLSKALLSSSSLVRFIFNESVQLWVIISDMVIFTLKVSVSLILILVV